MAAPSFKRNVIDLFGEELISYQDSEGQIGLELIPAKGLISDIKLEGLSILNGPKTKEDVESNSAYRSSFLAPFPNRLKAGKFTFQDKEYQFPINDVEFKNALHGIKIDNGFKITNEEARGGLNVSMEYNYDGGLDYFPFPYCISVDISIDSYKCQLGIQIQNTGATEAPLGIGWHPYLTLQQSIDDCQLCIPSCKQISLDESFIPDGKLIPFKDYAKCKTIGDVDFNTAFLFVKDADFTSVSLENDAYKLRYFQETKPEKFNYFQIYTPGDRESICFEPMSCNIDAHNNLGGLQVLKPGKKFRARCGVALQKK